MKRINIYFAISLWLSLAVTAQNPTDSLWHLLPYSKKGNAGIGYQEAVKMMKGKIPQPIIVAIADAGVDIYHPDLINNLWKNPLEIEDNGIDDDENGYIDDLYGWNFIGETTYDNMELTRQYARLNRIYELKPEAQVKNPDEYTIYLKMKEKFLKQKREAKLYFDFFQGINEGVESIEKQYGGNIDKTTIENHKSKGKSEEIAKRMIIRYAKMTKSFDLETMKKDLEEGYKQYDYMHNYAYNISFDPRSEFVGDEYYNLTERVYGNNQVYYGEDFSSHGTHVAGIVAADGSNDFGAKGICSSCKIMSIRNVPEGDERDKDVANGIRYAVDNGAKIVNMSFGKGYSDFPLAVKEAIQYAASKDVLLVHAAGNDGKNNDKSDNFPHDFKDAYPNWIEVGASNWKSVSKALAPFSNYGKSEVDLFSPGVDIYSTTPENQYEAYDGTSMASPVVSGVAAFVWSYYPSLSASQLKDIILQSSVPIKGRVKIPGSKRKTRALKLSKTGGLVNLPNALRLAKKTIAQP
jgi:subtilisin family serine protease